MMEMEGVAQNGDIVPDDAAALPEGMRVRIIAASAPSIGTREEDWSDSPEAIEAWIRSVEAFEPVEFTPEDRAAWKTARREQKEFETRQWEQRSKRAPAGQVSVVVWQSG